MTAWAVILAISVSTIVIKAAGPVLLGGRRVPPTLARMLALVGPALLSALVATGVFATGRHLVVDARAAGITVAAVALCLRAPPLLVVVLAAVTTAAVRAAGG